ncbi:MAG: ABC transporter permease [Nitrososphaeraceae archaeon]
MSFESISPKKLALIFGVAAVVIIFALLGSSAKNLFSDSITDEALVKIKEGSNCIVEAGDKIPRLINNCSYEVNDTILITYKAQQPTIEKHEPKP